MYFYGPPVTYSTTIPSSACFLVRHLSASPSTSMSREPSTPPSHEPSTSPSHEAPLLSRSWIHAATFDSTGSVKPALGFLEASSRSRPQPVNTTPLGLSWDQPSPSTSPK
ncbi:hypothetical protein E2C01_099546 [Portunus trituberculatus]|uniref:Uncharacterized protein n=1 Tax=Portunus trituberculatus TaxID=210409 RepID=A0A5B7KF91_PORTR|nr:hypothetical protein [Portunus trituberculatus]